jgi:excisionase family DNA binding protein
MENIIFDLIHAMNKMRDKIVDQWSKVENLSKSPAFRLNKKYLSEEEACRVLRCSRQFLLQLRDNGEIPYYRIHRRIMYQASDLHEFLEKHYVQT